MKMVYTNESIFLVSNVKNLIEAQGISSFIKNEFSQGATGEISVFDSWPEVWVTNDNDFERSTKIINESQNNNEGEDWVCEKCSEQNASSFEVCWNCGTENSQQQISVASPN
ncbi:DUF2007 domain-containing protein [Colwellia sp. 6_MG-2023]|uniref:putative signal transducing protein n=1 Tax=Colwellia sp. 6_MG-2023 TaxID=3062676 RepID=UPI0026E20289|nr:DUF2007 domain-containing protein [Colwellia sp. 6_MG-2023]MDO6488573.1 DUF2007 domain-containing protein [Colwellia sp. 6_MG-2023]